jgi:hypothetical protein
MTRNVLAAIAGAAFCLCVANGAAFAQTSPPSTANSHQTKMAACNAEAKTKNLSGDARKTFMKGCLSNKPAAATSGNSQQQKMADCNAQAKTKALSGDARKQFMSSCLKGSATP